MEGKTAEVIKLCKPIKARKRGLALPQYQAPLNEGKSAAGFCRQVAALFPDMFFNFYFVKKLLKTQQPPKEEKK